MCPLENSDENQFVKDLNEKMNEEKGEKKPQNWKWNAVVLSK